jgi:hypothetical protein
VRTISHLKTSFKLSKILMMVLKMKKIMLALLVVVGASALSGCVSEQQRIDRCVATGVSRDVCYHEEKEYWRNYQSNYATERAGESQADAIREGNQINRDHYDHQDYGTKKHKEHKSKLAQFFGE